MRTREEDTDEASDERSEDPTSPSRSGNPHATAPTPPSSSTEYLTDAERSRDERRRRIWRAQRNGLRRRGRPPNTDNRTQSRGRRRNRDGQVIRGEAPPSPHREPPTWPNWDPEEAYTLEQCSLKRHPNFPVESRGFRFHVSSLELETGITTEVYEKMGAIMHSAVEKMKRTTDPDNLGQLIVENPDLHSTYLSTPFGKVSDINYEALLDIICSALNSDESIDINSTIIHCVFCKSGKNYTPEEDESHIGGKTRRHSLTDRSIRNIDSHLKKATGVMDPMSAWETKCSWREKFRGMCFPLSLLDGKYITEQPDNTTVKMIHKWRRSKERREMALQLVKDSELGTPSSRAFGPFLQEEVKKIAHTFIRKFPKFAVHVFRNSGEPQFRVGDKFGRPLPIFISPETSHSYFIHKPTSFFGGLGYCFLCYSRLWKSSRTSHVCVKSRCKSCGLATCTNTESAIPDIPVAQCSSCLMLHDFEACAEAHEKIVCGMKRRCVICGHSYTPQKESDADGKARSEDQTPIRPTTKTGKGKNHVCQRQKCVRCKQVHIPFYNYCFVYDDGKFKAEIEREEEKKLRKKKKNPRQKATEPETDEESPVSDYDREQEDEEDTDDEAGIDLDEYRSEDELGSSDPEYESEDGEGDDIPTGQERQELIDNGLIVGKHSERPLGIKRRGESPHLPVLNDDEQNSGDDAMLISKARGSNADDKKGKRRRALKVFYYDYETTVGSDNSHQEVLLVVQRKLKSGRLFQRVYEGPQCTDDFIADLIAKASIYSNSVFVAHNASRFDGHLVLAGFLRQLIVPEVTARQLTILLLYYVKNNIKFIDSCLFIPSKLSDFSAIFSLPETKRHFPYKLCLESYFDGSKNSDIYLGEDGERFPPLRLFDPDNLRVEDRKRLAEWHHLESEKYRRLQLSYHVRQQLLSYCRGDVRLLRKGFSAFNDILQTISRGISVFTSLTLPSLSNKIFRKLYLENETLCILAPQGFTETQSKEAFSWFHYLRTSLGLHVVRHARNGFEVRVGAYKIDAVGLKYPGNPGAVGVGRPRVYLTEYMGCYFHKSIF